MTFGGLAAWQAWLLVAAAGGAAALVFRLKLRPPRVLIPSLLLWRRVLDEAREQTLWERIRRAVSLALTVVIALALAFAAVRPSRRGSSSAGPGRTLVVVDSSWSMLAEGPGGRRWDRAVAAARALVAATGGEPVAIATTSDGLVEGPTTDLALLDTALDRLAPGGGADAAWPQLAQPVSVHFFTDGAVARAIPPGVTVHSVFEPAPNVAITAFDVRPSLSGDQAGDAYLEISNFSPATANVRVLVRRGAASILDRKMDVGAGEVLRQTMPVGRGADAVLEASIETPKDSLRIDNEAVAWIEHARPLAVTVVGMQTTWLRTLLDRDRDVTATFVDPASYRPGAEDAVIFDRWAPPDRPGRPALLFEPPPATPWLAGDQAAPAAPGPDDERRPRWEVAGVHPVVAGVDPFTLKIDAAHAFRSSGLVPVAASASGMPLVYVSPPGPGPAAAPRLVLVTFSAADSSLASAPAFPVLVGNALAWLARPPVSSSTRPGYVDFDSATAMVTRPDGTALPLVPIGNRKAALLRAPGLYTVTGGGARSAVAVNVGDPQTSDLSRTTLTSAAQPARLPLTAKPWWFYCAVAAFLLALVEWWTWQRRITV